MNETRFGWFQLRLSSILFMLAIFGLITNMLVQRWKYEYKIGELNSRIEQLDGKLQQHVQIIDLEIQRDALLQIYSSSNPRVRSVDKQIELLKQFENDHD